jgi:hypothetical protein
MILRLFRHEGPQKRFDGSFGGRASGSTLRSSTCGRVIRHDDQIFRGLLMVGTVSAVAENAVRKSARTYEATKAGAARVTLEAARRADGTATESVTRKTLIPGSG